MKPVRRDELLDYQTYSEARPGLREQVLEVKQRRRVHVGPNLTFLFENRETVRYQIQEMMRVEQLVKEADIRHELETYNELLGGPGELGCTLLVEIDDEKLRAEKLKAWKSLPEHLYAVVDGARVRARYDARQVGESRLSSVQYLKIDVGGKAPSALGADHPDYTFETRLSDEQKAALAQDLAEG